MAENDYNVILHDINLTYMEVTEGHIYIIVEILYYNYSLLKLSSWFL